MDAEIDDLNLDSTPRKTFEHHIKCLGPRIRIASLMKSETKAESEPTNYGDKINYGYIDRLE